VPVTREDQFDFVQNFWGASSQFKSQFEDMWREVAANFVVDPESVTNPSTTSNPFRNQRTLRDGVILKDQETHKAIMAWASHLVQTVMGDDRGEYVRARPSGYEDAGPKSRTVTRLMRHSFGMDGVFRSMIEATIEALVYGTCVVEIPWRFRVKNMRQRTVETDPFTGIEFDSFRYGPVVTDNDPDLSVIDTQDAFPDPSEYRIDRMDGFLKRFRVNAFRAERNESYDQAAVARAKETTLQFMNTPQSEEFPLEDMFREGYDQPFDRKNVGPFSQMVGFEYWGEVPWRYTDPESSDPIQPVAEGTDRGVVTLLMGEIVRSRAYPLADEDLPFRTLTIVPTVGRFYGVSLGEVMRWDQDIMDALKVLLVEGVIRKVHPPIVYDENNEMDEARLRRWSPDVPIPIQGGPASIATLQYGSDVFSGIALGQQFRESAQSSVAATEALQGLPGPSREPATAASLRFQQALSRPGLTAALWERDELPKIAKSMFRRYQQFLPDSEALALRVGELPEPAWIGDIMGDFDFKFVGSRIEAGRAEKLQSFDRLTALAAAIPQANLLLPWMAILPEFVGDVLEMPEAAALIGNQNEVLRNMLLQSLGQGGGQGAGNGNGEVPRSEPAGTLPAQAAGNILG
jgi:hypothetical protein